MANTTVSGDTPLEIRFQTIHPRKRDNSMTRKNTFQKFFFGLIFVVTIIMFTQMYSSHKSNLAKIQCLKRSQELLSDLRLTSSATETLSLDSVVNKRDSIAYYLSQWGKKPGFYGFHHREDNSQVVEKILVSRHAIGDPSDESETQEPEAALAITWRRLAPESEWNSQIEIISLKLDTLYNH